MLRAGVSPTGTTSANILVRNLCAEIGLDPAAVDGAVRVPDSESASVNVARVPWQHSRDKVATLGAEIGKRLAVPRAWRAPHMLNTASEEGLQKPVARLAVLCLLVREEAARWDMRERLLDELPKEAKEVLSVWCGNLETTPAEMIEGLGKLVDIFRNEGEIEATEAANAITRLFQLGSDITRQTQDSLLGLVDRWRRDDNETGPLTPRFLARLIDPLPEQFDTADEDLSEGRIGKALARIDFGRPDPRRARSRAAKDGGERGKDESQAIVQPEAGIADGVKGLSALLSAGNGDQISASEREVMHRFALDLGFPKASWPSWMI
jgi:hypothetical protein